MAGLKAIKTKIRSIEKTETVTRAMEAVSAAKMRKAQLRAFSGRSYARAAVAILSRLSNAGGLADHPLTHKRSIERALYIVITSDKGLAGALNSGVLRAVVADIAALGLTPDRVSIIAVGKKAFDFFEARGYSVEAHHSNTDVITSTYINTIVLEAAGDFVEGRADIVKVAYPNLVTTFEQRPTIHTIFPLSLSELASVVGSILPVRGMAASSVHEIEPESYTIEPSESQVLEVILPKLAGIFVYHALLEAQASEHSARMVSMKSASDKAGEMEHDLTLQFNKARQAAITQEVSEITGGMEAMTTN